ncbi:hypothetical protein ACHAXM_005433 [Skeletonema potamos]
MELRSVEDTLKSNCKSWQELRRAREGAALPSLKQLFSAINDDDIFPPEPEVVPKEVPNGVDDETQKEDEKSDKECPEGASKPTLSTSVSVALSTDIYVGPEDVEDITDHEMTPQQILESLENIKKSLSSLAPKMNKFLQRLYERDPVTLKPRYGEKTMIRVKQAIRAYKAMEHGISGVFQDHTNAGSDNHSTLVSNLRTQVQRQEELMNEQRRALQQQEQTELERITNEKILAEKREIEERLQAEQRKREEELDLARRAEEARRKRIEEEQLALAAERQADANLLSLVPTKGPEGVREQIDRMREALKEDRAAFDLAIGSLYTLFDQITRKPEEVSFRRVRRDHPKFNEDIGRHVGGREVLIAAGFRMETLDGVKCFFSREPCIEQDMNGWSDWFDGLKKTLEVIEEEMIK